MATKQDKEILTLIKEVKAKEELIEKSEKPSWKTNLLFSFVEGTRNSAININVEKDIEKLIKMVSFLLERSTSYEAASKVLEISEPPQFKYDGYSLDDWISDIKTRTTKILINEEKQKLAMLKERLGKLISPEQQRELELEAIKKELGKK